MRERETLEDNGRRRDSTNMKMRLRNELLLLLSCRGEPVGIGGRRLVVVVHRISRVRMPNKSVLVHAIANHAVSGAVELLRRLLLGARLPLVHGLYVAPDVILAAELLGAVRTLVWSLASVRCRMPVG